MKRLRPNVGANEWTDDAFKAGHDILPTATMELRG
jgi:hypothetical protein